MHTVSKEVAKRLKEAGWNIETQFGYRDDGEFESNFIGYDISAPTLGELIRELPDDYFVSKDGRLFWRNDNSFPVEFELIADSDTPEDACAEAWLALQGGEK